MECQQEISTSNIQNYNRVKNIFQNLINNNVHNIILVGSGSNGKSYLMKDCCDIIKDNHYSISHNSPYNLTDDEFNNFIKFLPEKNILHFNKNPFSLYDINTLQGCIVIDMNHIRF